MYGTIIQVFVVIISCLQFLGFAPSNDGCIESESGGIEFTSGPNLSIELSKQNITGLQFSVHLNNKQFEWEAERNAKNVSHFDYPVLNYSSDEIFIYLFLIGITNCYVSND